MLKLIDTDPTLPISLSEIKAHLRIDTSAEDAYLSALIERATDLIETETNLDLRPKTWELILPKLWSKYIPIPRAPLVSIVSVTYYDQANEQQTLDSIEYFASTPTYTFGGLQLLIVPPTTYDRPDAATIRFTSGTSAPAIAEQAICLAVGTWFEHREGETEAPIRTLGLGFERLLDQLRMQ